MKLVISLWIVILSANVIAASSQKVYPYGYWVGDEKRATLSGDLFTPSSYQTVMDSGKYTTCVFDAEPKEGMKPVSWMIRNPGATGQSIDTFTKICDYTGALTWTYDAKYGSATYLGLKFDWIKYNLRYVQGSSSQSSTYIFTNKIQIASCDEAKTGYTFSGAWTNSSGKVLGQGVVTNGYAFGINEHRDGIEVRLYPKWKANNYNVTYNLNGGAFASAQPNSATYDQEFVVTHPDRTGYGFKEWRVSPSQSTAQSKVGNGVTIFKNLVSTDGANVSLSAEWTNSTYKITFNNHGASSGLSSLLIVYDKAYDAINIPVKSGSGFLGYYTSETGGERLWDEQGQPTREVWNISSDVVLHARWKSETYYVEYDANGGQGTINAQLVTNGISAVISDGTGIRYVGCDLLGWSRSPTAGTAEFALGSEIIPTTHLKLYAVWQINYFISFDGNGASDGEMPVERFVKGVEKNLPENSYVKSGYSFGGWAETMMDAQALRKKYNDGQLVKNLSDIPGSTNTLFAVWHTNTYYVAFDAGRGSGASMDVMKLVYDNCYMLPKCSFDPPSDLEKFDAWRDDMNNQSYSEGAVVSNLCTMINGTNTLVATWKLDVGEYSEAMDCTTLRWEIHNGNGHPSWEIYKNDGFQGSDSCVRQSGEGVLSEREFLSVALTESGTLTCYCKWDDVPISDQPRLCVGFSSQTYEFGQTRDDKIIDSTDWQLVTIPVQMPEGLSRIYVHLAGMDQKYSESNLMIDHMVWTPEVPDPGEDEPSEQDAPVISAIDISSNSLSVSIANGNSKFDYELIGTNSLTAPMPWPVIKHINGVDGNIIFDELIDPKQPQMFYKVEVIKKSR